MLKKRIAFIIMLTVILLSFSAIVSGASHTPVYRDDLGDVTGSVANSVYSTLDSALTGIGATNTTLYINRELTLTDTNVTVPSNVELKFMKGGSINVGPGKKLTINGNIDAPISKIFTINNTVVEACESAWNQQSVTGVTVSADTGDKQVGTASTKFVVADSAAAGILGTKAITSIDLTQTKILTLWYKSSIALNDGDLCLLLDDTDNCVSPLKETGLGKVAANTWYQINIDIGDTSSLTGITCIGIKQRKDKGAFTLWLDDVKTNYEVKFGNGSVEAYYPQWWGAAVDGTTDDTTAVQTSINAAYISGGGIVSFTKGTYLVNQLFISSNTELCGQGFQSVLKQKSGANYLLSVNPAFGGTTSVADNESNIKVRNVKLLGTVQTDGFAQWTHILNVSAVSDLLVENVKFVGFRGDGIYIASSNINGIERHNERITIRNCYFDGVNNDNRNAISVVDCDHLLVENCYFTNCSRPDMPGPIDLEPNGQSYTILRNIIIRDNKFFKNGGGGAIIGLVVQGQSILTNPVQHILIEGNYIDNTGSNYTLNGILLWQYQAVNENTCNADIVVRDNRVGNIKGRGFVAAGVKGVNLDSNEFIDIDNGCSLSSILNGVLYGVYDIRLTNNMFQRCGKSDGYGVIVRNANNILFDGNTFDNCGKSDNSMGYGVLFNDGNASSFVRFVNNIFTSPSVGRTTYAVKKGPSHMFSPATNIFDNNIQCNVPNNEFECAFSGNNIGTIISDGFENGFTNWTADTGTPSTSTAKVHGGAYSYILNEDADSITRTFPKLYGKGEVWFYDNISNTSGLAMALMDTYDLGGSGVGIGVSNPQSTSYYTYRVGSNFYTTTVARTTGWHKFTFDYKDANTDGVLYIDGVQIGTAAGCRGISRIILGDWWLDGVAFNAYFDDVSLTKY